MGKWARREMTMLADIVKAPPAWDERFAQTPIAGHHHRPIRHDGAFVLCNDTIEIKHFLVLRLYPAPSSLSAMPSAPAC